MSAFWKTFGWYADQAKALCGADAEFLAYLTALPTSGRHYLAIIMLRWKEVQERRLSAVALAEAIRTKPRKAMLHMVLDGCPDGLVAVLGKIGGRVLPRQRYRVLLELLAEPKGAKVLWHAEHVRPALIDTLSAIAPPFRLPRLMLALETRADVESLRYAIRVIRRLYPTVPDRQIAASLRLVSDRDGLGDWFEGWLNRAPLPNSPWEGSSLLQPLATASALREAAIRYQNCLDEQILNVLSGRRFYYAWIGPTPAVIALRSDPFLGWVVGEMHGAANRPVSGAVRAAILEAFEKHGFLPLEPDCPLQSRFVYQLD